MNVSVQELASKLGILAEPLPMLEPPAPAAPQAPAVPGTPVAVPPGPVQITDYALRGVHLDVRVTPDKVVEAARVLDREGFAFDSVTGVDWLAENQMEIVYDYFHPHTHCRVAVRTRVPREKPELQTVMEVFPGADWHERETHDFFGIKFLGNPNQTPFLLPEDATFHPLRKDYTP